MKAQIIQEFVDSVGGPDYLEIGVDEGHNLSQISAKNKVGVDPSPKYWDGRIYQMTSDEFFSQKRSIDGVIFIDGLHTYEQSLRDIENSVRCMSDRSVILVHDCCPPNEEAAQPDPRGYGHEWCGDVWKSIAHIRTTRTDLNVYTIKIPYGLAVIKRGDPESMLDLKVQDINGLDFQYFKEHRQDILNLKER